MPEINLDIIKQAAERSAMTFVQTFFAMFVVTDLSSAKGAATAAEMEETSDRSLIKRMPIHTTINQTNDSQERANTAPAVVATPLPPLKFK